MLPDQGRGVLYRLVLTHSPQLLRTTNLFLQADLTEAKPAFLLMLPMGSSAKTEASLFITEVPLPTIPSRRIDVTVMVHLAKWTVPFTH